MAVTSLTNPVDLLLHVDKYVALLVQDYGIWVYLLVFLIIFLETGLVFTPFFPGDSLLFVLGALAAAGTLNFSLLIVVLSLAAILGDSANYWIGNTVGHKIFRMKIRFLKKEYLKRTEEFYDKYGGKTIVLARFVPIVRTFAPFVAGIGKMNYRHFISYNVVGGVMWVAAFLTTGYFFGNLPIIKDNLSAVLLGIIVISLAFAAAEMLKHRKTK